MALVGELRGSRGSFLPCVPIQQLGACRAVPAAFGNLRRAGRKALCRQILNMVPKRATPPVFKTQSTSLKGPPSLRFHVSRGEVGRPSVLVARSCLMVIKCAFKSSFCKTLVKFQTAVHVLFPRCLPRQQSHDLL